MPGPESNFWQSLRRGLPKDCLATRLENRAGGGIPDVHILLSGLPFWVELKIANDKTVKLSPHQIAWHTAYSARQGLSFFLVKHLPSKNMLLIQGHRAKNLATEPVANVQHLCFTRTDKLFDHLRAEVKQHYVAILQQ